MTGPEVRPEHEKTIESTKFVRIAERFKQGMRREVRSETRRENKKREVKGRRQIEISSSESESSSHMARPVTPIVTKAMPTKGETRRRNPPPLPVRQPLPPAQPKTRRRSARDTRSRHQPQKQTSQRAKELFKDADAAKEVYSQFTQEFTNIQWF